MQEMIGKFVLVRCREAGVHAGYLVSAKGRRCVLRDARRLWRWAPLKTKWLSGVAVHGIAQGSMVGAAVSRMYLPETCEIALCSEAATTSITSFPVEEVV